MTESVHQQCSTIDRLYVMEEFRNLVEDDESLAAGTFRLSTSPDVRLVAEQHRGPVTVLVLRRTGEQQ